MVNNSVFRIVVIDGQGGGIGAQIVDKLSRKLPAAKVEIIAIGTNALAASRMLKAGANEAVSGENAIIFNARRASLIVGTIGMIMPFGFCGEMTTSAAEAVALAPVPKYILHLNRSEISIIGSISEPLPHLVDLLVKKVLEYISI